MTSYYDRQGKPIDVAEWASTFDDFDTRVVARSESEDVTVSTVWLGLDHQYGDGPPLIFETMIFGGDHDEYQERYSTEAEALEGHKRACVRAGLENDGQ